MTGPGTTALVRADTMVPFHFGNHEVRIDDRDGQPWFVLGDVCRVLELANVSDAAARVRAHERDDLALTDAMGREQQVIVVNEAGLYRLIMRSRKPAAERFSDWVVSEVLPTIRRTGSYGPGRIPFDLNDNATLRALLLGRIDRLVTVEPKADAFDRIADAGGALTFTAAAKILKIGRDQLLTFLREQHWIYRASGNGRWTGYRDKEVQGLIQHRVSRIRSPNGPDKVAQSALITAKGLAKLATMLAVPS